MTKFLVQTNDDKKCRKMYQKTVQIVLAISRYTYHKHRIASRLISKILLFKWLSQIVLIDPIKFITREHNLCFTISITLKQGITCCLFQVIDANVPTNRVYRPYNLC